MPLEALSCVTQEFLSRIAALFCRALHHFHAICDRAGNRFGRSSSLASRFANVFRCSFHHCL
jgi:hypothetical protein